MKVISWNCRGIKNEKCLRNCRDMVIWYEPSILALLERKLNPNSMAAKIARKFGFNCFCLGFSGWHFVTLEKGKCSATIRSTSQAIHTLVGVDGRDVILSCLYVQPHFNMKELFWTGMEVLAKKNTLPWVVIGDFNDIASIDEKWSGAQFCLSKARLFVERVDAFSLFDMGATGVRFTWFRKVHGKVTIRERLDRVLVNTPAQLLFPESRLVNLPSLCSDHHPILWHSHLSSPPPLPYEFTILN